MKLKNIGAVIYDRLKHLVDGKVYPLVAENTTDYPFITYQRTSTACKDSKDRYICAQDNIVTINVLTEDYEEGLEILDDIMERFDNLEGTFSDVEVLDSTIENISEDYHDAYILTVEIKIKTC